MNANKLKKIIKLLEESNISEIEIKSLFNKVRISKKPAPIVATDYTGETQEIPVIAPVKPAIPLNPPSNPAASVSSAVDEKKTAEEEKLAPIISPMVGTFYAAPSPAAENFVKEGQHITRGTTVCIIEAMKLMNEIESEINGTVVKILVQNQQPIEYGQKLFLIKPD